MLRSSQESRFPKQESPHSVTVDGSVRSHLQLRVADVAGSVHAVVATYRKKGRKAAGATLTDGLNSTSRLPASLPSATGRPPPTPGPLGQVHAPAAHAASAPTRLDHLCCHLATFAVASVKSPNTNYAFWRSTYTRHTTKGVVPPPWDYALCRIPFARVIG
jgi:hypothetical protein